jgi:hypothetical protein
MVGVDAPPAERSPGTRLRLLIGGGCILLLLLGLGLPLIAGEIYLDSDLRAFHLPMRHFYAECLAAGQSFVWFPYQYNGIYLHGEGQLGLYHPLNLASYAWLPFSVAFNLEMIRAFVFLLFGAYWLGRRWQLPADAALLAGFLCAFSGFNIAHFMHLNVLNIVAHLPYALLAIDTAMKSPRPARVGAAAVALALLTASQLHLGHPQFVWFCLVVEAAYAASLLQGRREWVRGAWLLSAQLVAPLVAAIAILPQWESLQTSIRAEPDPAFPFSLSLPITHLGEFVSPWLFAPLDPNEIHPEFAVYDGSMTLILLAWAFLRRREIRTGGPGLRSLSVLAIAALLLSLGKLGVLYSIQALLPVVGLFRVPARYLLLVHMAFGVLAAFAFADLVRVADRGLVLPWRRLQPLFLPCVLSLGIAGAGTVWHTTGRGPAVASELSEPALLWIGPALLALAAGLVIAAARGHRWALAAILAFVVADHGSFGMNALARDGSDSVANIMRETPVPEWGFDYRVHFAPEEITLRGVRLTGGYVAMEPLQRLRTRDYDLVRGKYDAALVQSLRISNVRKAFGQDVPVPMPRARLVTRVVREKNLDHQLAVVDVDRTAIVDADIALPPGAPGIANIVEERPGEIVIATMAKTRQLLVLTETHHPGWRARVDGADCEVLRVYGDFMGCVVPEGLHRVHFDFEPESLRQGARISAAGTLLLGVLFAGAAWTCRSDPADATA